MEEQHDAGHSMVDTNGRNWVRLQRIPLADTGIFYQLLGSGVFIYSFAVCLGSSVRKSAVYKCPKGSSGKVATLCSYRSFASGEDFPFVTIELINTLTKHNKNVRTRRTKLGW